jgi:TonB-linked SusC/RagA family outer membrane protein
MLNLYTQTNMLKIYIFMGRFKANNATNLGALLMIFLTLFLSEQSLAQELKLIRGTVFESNKPLGGVGVKVKGSTTGAVSTSSDGKYSIQAKSTDMLVFTYVGMETQEVLVGNRTTLDITLKESASSLDELVVVGYQTIRKKDLTGAVGQVNISDVVKAPVAGFAEALAGRVAGVQVSSGDGQPGATMNIQIRGQSSINNSVQPLYIIDGFATENAESINLNPDDIESITVLKDAASTAVYGSRGTNGVIVIVTKSGKIGAPVVSFNSSYGTQNVINFIELMDPYEFVKYQAERNATDANANYFTNGKTLDSYRNVQGIDWNKEISRTGSIFKNNISLRGGNETTQYSISGAGFKQDGVLLNTGYQRYQGRVKLDQKISEKFKVGISADYADVTAFGMQASSQPATNNSLSSLLWFRAWAYRPVAGSNTTYDLLEEDSDPESIVSSDIRLNPRISLENEYLYNKYSNFTINGYLNYNVLKHLVLKIQGTKNILKTGTDRFYNSHSLQGSSANPLNNLGQWGSTLAGENNIWANENTLTYTNTFSQKHNIMLLAGNSQTYGKSKSYGYTSTNLPNESLGMAGLNEGEITSPIATGSANALSSFFGIADYNFNSKYYLKAALRADGSSKFYDHWGYFPMVAAAWNMQNEDFLKNSKVISLSKIRVSYGVTGNNRVDDFARWAQLSTTQTSGYPFNGQSTTGAYISNLQSDKLQWERTFTKDIGYEIGLFKDRIDLTIDAYDKLTKNLLITGAPVAPSSGFATTTKNIGSLNNRGLEFTLNTINIRNKKFSWESSFNISFNKNKIVALNEGQRLIQTNPSPFDVSFGAMYVSAVGQPLGLMYGYQWLGNYQYSDFDNPSPGVYILKPGVSDNGLATVQPGDIKYADLNGDGTVNTLDRTIIGRGQPKHYGGFSNNFTYGNFSLNVFLQWSYGNNLYNANRIILEGNANGRTDMNQFASYEDRWSPTNQDSENYRAGGQGVVGYHSSRVVEDGSYLRLKTAMLSYSLPKKLIQRAHLNALSLNISGQNLLTWTKYTGMDPEVSVRGGLGVLTPGFDFSPYPQARTVVFGLNASF